MLWRLAQGAALGSAIIGLARHRATTEHAADVSEDAVARALFGPGNSPREWERRGDDGRVYAFRAVHVPFNGHFGYEVSLSVDGVYSATMETDLRIRDGQVVAIIENLIVLEEGQGFGGEVLHQTIDTLQSTELVPRLCGCIDSHDYYAKMDPRFERTKDMGSCIALR